MNKMIVGKRKTFFIRPIWNKLHRRLTDTEDKVEATTSFLGTLTEISSHNTLRQLYDTQHIGLLTNCKQNSSFFEHLKKCFGSMILLFSGDKNNSEKEEK